jgi:hypothetical protein
MTDNVNHPQHYGGDTTYETIKVIEAWELGFNLGNAVKYISRAGRKDHRTELEDLRKAAWYLNREIEAWEKAKLAQGGLIRSGTPYLVGEAGHPVNECDHRYGFDGDEPTACYRCVKCKAPAPGEMGPPNTAYVVCGYDGKCVLAQNHMAEYHGSHVNAFGEPL